MIKRYCVKAGHYGSEHEVFPVVLTEADRALLKQFVEFLEGDGLINGKVDFLEVHYKEEVVYD